MQREDKEAMLARLVTEKFVLLHSEYLIDMNEGDRVPLMQILLEAFSPSTKVFTIRPYRGLMIVKEITWLELQRCVIPKVCRYFDIRKGKLNDTPS